MTYQTWPTISSGIDAESFRQNRYMGSDLWEFTFTYGDATEAERLLLNALESSVGVGYVAADEMTGGPVQTRHVRGGVAAFVHPVTGTTHYCIFAESLQSTLLPSQVNHWSITVHLVEAPGRFA